MTKMAVYKFTDQVLTFCSFELHPFSSCCLAGIFEWRRCASCDRQVSDREAPFEGSQRSIGSFLCRHSKWPCGHYSCYTGFDCTPKRSSSLVTLTRGTRGRKVRCSSEICRVLQRCMSFPSKGRARNIQEYKLETKWKQTFSSFPSVISMTILPARFLPVRPILCTKRVGDLCASKQIIRSTSPISKPSSPTQVDTSVLYPPARNSFITFTTKRTESIFTFV